jgi:hypothetical protein
MLMLVPGVQLRIAGHCPALLKMNYSLATAQLI